MKTSVATLAIIMAAMTSHASILFQESFTGTTITNNAFNITDNGTYVLSARFVDNNNTGANASDVVAGLDYGNLKGCGLAPAGNSVRNNAATNQNRFRLATQGLTLNEGETVYFSALIEGTKRANFGFYNYTGVSGDNWEKQIMLGLNTQVAGTFDANRAASFDGLYYDGNGSSFQKGTSVVVPDDGTGVRLILGRIVNNAGDNNDVIELHVVLNDSSLTIGSTFSTSDLDGAGDSAQFYSKSDYNFGGNLSLTNFNFALQNDSTIDEIIFATAYSDVFYGNPTALLPPEGVSVTATAPAQATLAWDVGRNAQSYNIYRSLASGAYGAALANVGPASVTNFVDNSVANFSTYYYQITSVSNSVESAPSAEVSVFTHDPSDTTPPQAPVVNLSVAGSRIVLDWADNAEPDFAGYAVYRSDTSSTGTNGTLLSAGSTNSIYRDDELPVGTTYYYRVAASDVNGNTSFGNEVDGAAVAPTPADEVNIYFIMTNNVVYGFGSINADGNISALGQGSITNGIPVATNAAYGMYQGFTADPGGKVYGIAAGGEVVAWSNVASFVAGTVPATLSTNAAYAASTSNDVRGVSFDPTTGGFFAATAYAPYPGDLLRYPDVDAFLSNTIDSNLVYATDRAGSLVNMYYSQEDAPGNLGTLQPGANIFMISGSGDLEGWQTLDAFIPTAGSARTFKITAFAPSASVAGGFALIRSPASAIGQLDLAWPTISWDGEAQANYKVQSRSNLIYGDWIDIESLWSVSNETLNIVVSPDANATFYRVISE